MRRANPLLLLLPTLAAIALGALFVVGYRADIPVTQLTARYASAESEFVDVAGMRVHFRDEGRGQTPLVLLHGTGSSLHTWDEWIELLGFDFRLIRVDLPGFGLTGPHPDSDYRVAAYVDFLDAFTRAIGLDEFHLAGNSLGGRIAWNYAVAHPDRVLRLVLIDTAGYPREEALNTSTIMRLAKMPIVNKLLETMTPRFLVADSLREVYGDPGLISDELIDRYYELSLRPGNRRAFVERALDAAADVDRDHRHISQPTLIIWGAEDRWIPLADGRGFAADIENARLLVYPGVGHLPMEELPGPTARATLEFLQKEASPDR
jgi:pimeloyl-ACP methyl ester carboxylesterase